MYAKLFTSIYQGTLRGNSHGLLVFTNLLAHCDKHGEADIHPRAIAEEVGLTVEQVRAALLVLESPDDESRSPEEQGRRIVRKDGHRDWGWIVVNFLKYRAIRDEDDRREQNRLAQERWRNKNKPTSADVEANQPIQKQIHKQEILSTPSASHPRKRGSAGVAGFDLFWSAYPRKTAKSVALKRFVALAPDTDLLDAMIAAVQKQKTWDAWKKDGGAYIPHASTWINGRRWEDEQPECVPVQRGGVTVAPSESTEAYKARMAREAAQARANAVKPPASVVELLKRGVAA